jgi:hypothetical protein
MVFLAAYRYIYIYIDIYVYRQLYPDAVAMRQLWRNERGNRTMESQIAMGGGPSQCKANVIFNYLRSHANDY